MSSKGSFKNATTERNTALSFFIEGDIFKIAIANVFPYCHHAGEHVLFGVVEAGFLIDARVAADSVPVIFFHF